MDRQTAFPSEAAPSILEAGWPPRTRWNRRRQPGPLSLSRLAKPARIRFAEPGRIRFAEPDLICLAEPQGIQ